MKFTVQSTFPGRRRNSPRAESLCTDLSATRLPLALFIADEAEITVGLDIDSATGDRRVVRALIGVGVDDEFADAIRLIGAVPTLGLIEVPHVVDLTGTVETAITKCATAFAAGIAEALSAAERSAYLTVLDHNGTVVIDTTC